MYALTESISELLGVRVSERSENAMVRCPLHDDHSPSFSINLNEGMWHCFGCQESGTLRGLYRRLGEEVSPDVRLAQAKRNAEAPEIFERNFSGKANGYIRNLRLIDGASRYVDAWLESRSVAVSARDKWRLGLDTIRDTITFPYWDEEGRVTGIKHRYPSGFKASETGSKYGLYGVTELIGRDRVIICEGESDVLRVWSGYGDHYAVGGTSGASVSEAQWSTFALKLLYASRVYLLYDGDEAGDKCSSIAMRMLGDDKCVRLRPVGDATEWLDAGHTLEELGLE